MESEETGKKLNEEKKSGESEPSPAFA